MWCGLWMFLKYLRIAMNRCIDRRMTKWWHGQTFSYVSFELPGTKSCLRFQLSHRYRIPFSTWCCPYFFLRNGLSFKLNPLSILMGGGGPRLANEVLLAPPIKSPGRSIGRLENLAFAAAATFSWLFIPDSSMASCSVGSKLRSALFGDCCLLSLWGTFGVLCWNELAQRRGSL